MQNDRAKFKNVVRGFSLVLHDPEGSHYKIWRACLAMTSRKRGNLGESQNSKIKMQNDGAKMKKQSASSGQLMTEG